LVILITAKKKPFKYSHIELYNMYFGSEHTTITSDNLHNNEMTSSEQQIIDIVSDGGSSIENHTPIINVSIPENELKKLHNLYNELETSHEPQEKINNIYNDIETSYEPRQQTLEQSSDVSFSQASEQNLEPIQQPIQKPYPYTPTIQSQPIQQRSFFGNIVDGFAFGTGSTIARNMFSSSTNTNTETKIIEKEKIVKIDCYEFTKCNEFKENGDKFLYNECIKKLPNKISDYETCLLSR